MKLKVLGSSSAGNCYIIENESSALIIEAGIHLKDVKNAIDYNVSKVVGVLVTHCHGDHSKYAIDYFKAGLRVMTSRQTFESLNFPFVRQSDILEDKKAIHIGEFKILAFKLEHDVHCFGFLIHHPDTGNILFATDTHFIKYKFPKLSTIMIECNYDEEILDNNVLNGYLAPVVRHRVMQSHMSIDTVETMLQANDLTMVRNIVLMHLSGGNSDENQFVKRIESLTGKRTTIANKGTEINLNLNPF